MVISITSNSPLQTIKIGKIFSKILDTDDVILLDGELGAGKTTFISGIAEGLGLKEGLSSPSFTILNIYPLKRNRIFVHADLYRLEDIDEIFGTGVEDYFYSRGTFTAIEWGSRIRDHLKKDYVEIEFNYILENNREDGAAGSEPGLSRSIVFRSESRNWIKKLVAFKKLVTRGAIATGLINQQK